MKYLSLVIPVVLIVLLVYASVKKVKVYDSFAVGAGKGLSTVFSVFPCDDFHHDRAFSGKRTFG